MVLETLVDVKDAIKNPWKMLLFGIAISAIALGISYAVFPENAGLLTVFLIAIMMAPFMWKLLKQEEWHEESELRMVSGVKMRLDPREVVGRHSKIFLIYAAFFVGVVVGLSLIFWVLPDEIASSVFDDQRQQLNTINSIMGRVAFEGPFGEIFLNNIIVMVVSFVFALLFGIGAVFILAWNASVLAAAVGVILKTSGLSLELLRFLPHGVFEIAAYFVAGISGGVISAALAKRGTKLLGPVLLDMLFMMVIAAVLVFIGAIVESSSFI